MKNYFETIPKDIEDAAMIDGCTPIGALFKIILPISAPGLVATGIFAFLGAWNEFFLALIFMTKTQTITLAISALVTSMGRYRMNFPLVSTAAIIASIPPILLALFFQRFILKGLTSGSIKG